MNKKLAISFLLVFCIIINGVLVFISYKITTKISNKAVPITYLISTQDTTKYCNGVDMNSVAYRKTIITLTTTTLPANLSEIGLVKFVINAATTGMCQTALNQLDILIIDGTVQIPPLDGWAGISIALCSCKPQVEINLLRIPGISKVVWQ